MPTSTRKPPELVASAAEMGESNNWRFGIILDAGSSGTRLHIYRWVENGSARSHADEGKLKSLPVIETKNKWTEKIHPGVSSFGEKPHRVGPDHLEKLFEKARKIIPDKEAERTPLFLLATAGMRLLDDDPRERLLKEICSYAQLKTKFQLPDCGVHIQVIPGEVEGLYGWVAANYLLGGFDAPLKHANPNDHPTYGFLDMGGASAQIAFAPSAKESEKHANDLLLMRLRTLDGTSVEYKVFTTTWLGFGVNQARKHYVERLEKDNGSKGKTALEDPCLPPGLTTTITGDVLLPDSKDVKGKTQYLQGTGKFQECLKRTYPLLDKDHVCKDEPCLIGGTHVPPIDFTVNHFVGVSEYWHTTHEIFEHGHKNRAYDFNTYQKRVSDFCSRDWSKIEASIAAHEWGKKVDEKTAVEVCFKASWLINVLHEGIGIPRVGLEDMASGGEQNGTKKLLDNAKDKGFTPSFRPVNKIDDTELSWTLGKMVLYASSQIPPADKGALPVGFGDNAPGIPANFQYPYSHLYPFDNTTIEPPASEIAVAPPGVWSSKILHAGTVRRLPGILLFLLIFLLAGFLLCSRARRHRLYARFSPSPTGNRRLPPAFPSSSTIGGLGKRNLLASKVPSIFRSSASSPGSYERVLEEGHASDEFELDGVDFADDYNDTSDSSSGSQAGRTSGWATPRLRGTNGARGSSDALSALGTGHGLGIGLAAGRTESRERMAGMGDGGRRLGSLIED